jgi:serralysin
MSGHTRGGADVLNIITSASTNLWGDASGTITDFARGGDDILTGDGSIVFLRGDGTDMSGHTRGGDDILTVDVFVHGFLYGDAEVMSDHARGGDDILTVVGGDPDLSPVDNHLYGDAETLSDHARGGNDRLISGAGTDHMYGDAATIAATALTGDDTFVFGPNSGEDSSTISSRARIISRSTALRGRSRECLHLRSRLSFWRR